MTPKQFFIAPIKAYQFVSKMLPANCRYYPTCSEYATWQFEFNRADKALFASTKRILSCNQLFKGGIDYPLVTLQKPISTLTLRSPNSFYGKITFWIIPKIGTNQYYIIKDFNATKETHTP
jgi:putative membrane protein insertion efficiency factor